MKEEKKKSTGTMQESIKGKSAKERSTTRKEKAQTFFFNSN